MRTSLDCIPCLVRHALESARHASPDIAFQEKVMREVLGAISAGPMKDPPVLMGGYIHRLVRNLTGLDDPYRQAKDQFNLLALRLYPEMKERVRQSADPLEAAARWAIAGNIIDFGLDGRLDHAEVQRVIQRAMTDPLIGDVPRFKAAVAAARDILYLADNAGEIVFDRLLIEQIGPHKITLAVRGRPVVNDATRADAEAAGLSGMVEIIDNGSDVPGTHLPECSAAFRQRFDRADLVIAKGQGNFETLGDLDRNIFFLLKAKCAVVARELNCERGSMVVHRSAGVI
jgi:uncharacterized protein with ATP-grasp and redox domains